MSQPLRVFLSHTSELRRYPPRRSFVDAAEQAVSRAGQVVGDMAYFTSRDQLPEQVDRDAVLAAGVYVAIVGFRYGSPLPSRADLSHTEWEFEVASQAGMPRLVFLLGEHTEGPSGLFVDVEYAPRQAAFRRRLAASDLTLTTVTTPEGLGEALYQALRDLPPREPDGDVERLPIWHAPPRNPNFVGRDEELARIRAHFADGQVVAVQALRGMGGIGKTHTAIEYAHRHTSNYDLVWWIDAEQPALIVEQLATLAAAMGLPAAPDSPSTIHAVRMELRRRQRWLLVFDNAEQAEDLQPILPGGVGHVLITTRRGGFRAVGAVLELDVIDRAEAVSLLCRRAPQVGKDEANALAEQLGDLPLALEQAAAYLDQTGLPAAEYLSLLQKRAHEMYGRGRVVDHQHTIATLWSLSVARLRAVQPDAVEFLQLCAWLAPVPIPIDLFTRRPDLLPEPLDRVAADPVRMADVVGTLVDHSLVRHTGNAVLLHRLTQAVLRRPTFEGQQRHPLAVVLALLRDALPEDITHAPHNWPRWQQLLPHVLVASDHHDDAQPVAADDVGWLLDRAAAYVGVARVDQREIARPLLERALRIRMSIYDLDDVRVAATMHNLGKKLADGGDKSEARPLLERALSVREDHYGPNHSSVADSLTWLGSVLTTFGDSGTALQVLERALRIQERVLGSSHIGITATLNHLGAVYLVLGRPAKARDLSERALSIRESFYGPDHPWTATYLNNLGHAHLALGDAAAARLLFEQALRIRESTYGSGHFAVARSLTSLGLVMVMQKEFSAARPLLERALRIGEAAHGPNHQYVASTLRVLGFVLAESDEPIAARAALERALQIHESLDGLNPLYAADVLIDFSRVLIRFADHATARRHLKRAMEIVKVAHDLDGYTAATCRHLLQQLDLASLPNSDQRSSSQALPGGPPPLDLYNVIIRTR